MKGEKKKGEEERGPGGQNLKGRDNEWNAY